MIYTVLFIYLIKSGISETESKRGGLSISLRQVFLMINVGIFSLLWAIKYIKWGKKEVEVKLACSPSVGLPGNILQHVQGEFALNSTQKKS